MIGVYGVAEGTPYEKWPTQALERLKSDLGRNGPTKDSDEIFKIVSAILAEKKKEGGTFGTGEPYHTV